MTFDNFQRGPSGGIGWARPHVKAGAQHAADAVGVSDIRMLFQDQHSVGLHKNGQDVDFQAGTPYFDDAFEVHEALADELIANRKAYGLRYLLWNGSEWGGTAGWHKRPQPRSWGGSDAWHKNHVHASWFTTPNGQSLGSIKQGVSVEQVKRAQQILTDLGYYEGLVGGGLGDLTQAAVTAYQKDSGLVADGMPGPITIKHMEDTVSKIDEILDRVTKTNHAVGRMEPLVRALAAAPEGGDIDPADIAHIRKRIEQNNAALGRMDPGKKGERA